MASVIRLRRKKKDSSQDTAAVALLAGEPFYDAEKKNLYIGNEDGETVGNKKHVAEVTNIGENNTATIKFQVGENAENVVEHTVNNVDLAKSLTLKEGEYGTALPASGTKGRVFFVELTD